MRLYMAALLGVELKGSADFNFTVKDAKRLLEQDCKKLLQINLDNEVATANNKIEFLLDKAEKHIRDAALCGWAYRGGQLER